MAAEIGNVKQLIAAGESVMGAWRKAGPVRRQDLARLVFTLAIAAERTIPGPKRGADKHAAVREAFDALDERYRIIERIDGWIKFPRWLSWFEAIDGKIIRWAVDMLIAQAAEGADRWAQASRRAKG